jgi:pSer/pThr/pTyr-binding forkhead associated (FHA) protein
MGATLAGVSGRFELGTTRLSIGRAPDNQLVLTDTQVSGYHAEVLPEGEGYSIIDLGSSNGTFVNGYRLTPNVPRILNPNDQLQFGQHFGNPLATLTYQVQDAVFVEPTVLASPPAPDQGPSPRHGYSPPPPPPPPGQVSQPPRQESQVKAPQRPPIREIVSGQANYTPAAGMSEKELADLLAPLAKLSSGNYYIAMKAGEALGKAMGIKSTKQLSKQFPPHYQYTSVVLACILALRHLQNEIVSMYDTPRGSVVELKMATDLWSFGGMLTIEFIDEGPSGIVVNGESEIRGQMFDWGKGKRSIEEIFNQTERYLKRLTGY